MRKKLTIKDLLESKGKKKLSEVYVNNYKEALACEKAGIDMIITSEINDIYKIRKNSQNIFLTVGLVHGKHVTEKKILKASYRALKLGADAIYCPQGIKFVKALSHEDIAVIGHVGFIPYKSSWFGGYKAVGKTVEDAINVYNLTKAYEDAGAIGVEMEIVPSQIAEEITKRTKILVISMGSGKNCDAQYLFADDILGYNESHIPRHAKIYRNHKKIYEEILNDSIDAFKEFKKDVEKGLYPENKHIVNIDKEIHNNFINKLETK